MSFDDINNPSAIRMALKTKNNTSFPATNDPNFLKTLIESNNPGDYGTISIPTSYSSRSSFAANNPIQYVLEFKILLCDIISILLGIKPDNISSFECSRKPKYFRKKRKGIFGNTLAFYGVVEEHQKKTLHTHICAWGGLSPELLQKYSNVQHICDQISSTMNRMYTAKLNNDVIVTNTVRNVLRKHGCKFSWNPRETPSIFKNIQTWESANNNNEQSNEQKAYSYDYINNNIQFQAAIQQWHTHTFTCKKRIQWTYRL